MKYGKDIKKLRNKMLLTQTQFAKFLENSYDTVN